MYDIPVHRSCRQLAAVWRIVAVASLSRPRRVWPITWTSSWSVFWHRSSWIPSAAGTRQPGAVVASTAGGSWNTCSASRGKPRAARTSSFSNVLIVQRPVYDARKKSDFIGYRLPERVAPRSANTCAIFANRWGPRDVVEQM